MLHLHIDCVDGETYYGHSSHSKQSLLRFLERYDHEGSNITLVVQINEKREIFHDEDAYKKLIAEEN